MTLRMRRKVSSDRHPESYGQFFTEWLRLLQVYVFPETVVHLNAGRINEAATLRAFAEYHEPLWPNLGKAALGQLVTQRYVRQHVLGPTQDDDTQVVLPRVKHATDHLRALLGVSPATIVGMADPHSFESGRPVDLTNNPFTDRAVAATVTLLYQIRCNLFHGVKGYRNQSQRTGLLTSLGVAILRDLMYALN